MQAVSANRRVLSGNEAIAHAAWAAGVELASAYPGTPSTEILENIARHHPDVYAEWAVNEKVAMEVAIGASFAGARALTTMKHVGLNVALDPLMTFTYIGANGGLVIVCADDPGMHSSQNEQDNRTLAKFARVPMLEPSDSQECYDMTLEAYEISERFGTPVILRTTTRINHSSGIVDLGDFTRKPRGDRAYEKDMTRTVMVPMFARRQRVALEEKLARLSDYSEKSPLQRIERGGKTGIITSGISYQYAREAFPEASILRLGMTFPLPKTLIREFAASVDKVYVIEEGDPYLEEQVLAMGVDVRQPEISLRIGELSPDRIERLAAEVHGEAPLKPKEAVGNLPARPPVLCPGCSHRGVFYALNRLKATVLGDIGCYSLGAFPPLSAMDSIVCMGASIGNAHGMQKSGSRDAGARVAAILGDSTFFHSGITGLLNIVYNRGMSTVIVLDNRTTAMTGHQQHPGTGRTLMGQESVEASVEEVARGVGVKRVRVVDPYNLEETFDVLKEELDSSEPSVIVSKRACVLSLKAREIHQFSVDLDACKACGACLKLGCPAIEITDQPSPNGKGRKVRINPVLCVGCGMCAQVCKFDAVKEAVSP